MSQRYAHWWYVTEAFMAEPAAAENVGRMFTAWAEDEGLNITGPITIEQRTRADLVGGGNWEVTGDLPDGCVLVIAGAECSTRQHASHAP